LPQQPLSQFSLESVGERILKIGWY